MDTFLLLEDVGNVAITAERKNLLLETSKQGNIKKWNNKASNGETQKRNENRIKTCVRNAILN